MGSFLQLVCAALSPGPIPSLHQEHCRHRLGVADGRVVARAAAAVALHRWQGCTTALQTALASWSLRTEPEAAVVCLFLLDALVQVDANVPHGLLRPMLCGITEPVAFVLLARGVRRHEHELLAGFCSRPPHDAGGGRDLRWVAEGNLLCGLRTPGIASALLRGLDWSLMIDVPADCDSAAAEAAPAVVLGGGDQIGGHAGFPPLPAYSLVEAADGDELLAIGAPTVGYRRQLATSLVSCGLGFTNQEQVLRRRWLEQLVDGDVPSPAATLVLPFTTAAAWLAAVDAATRRCHEARRRLVRQLAHAGALSPQEATTPLPPLRVSVRDQRADGEPLPQVVGAGILRFPERSRVRAG